MTDMTPERRNGMTTPQSIDEALVEAFLGKAMVDTASAVVMVMASIGDRLGLFKQLAEAGRGQGGALIKLAQSYPQSRFVGYDTFAPAVARACASASAADVADRVRFECLDVSEGLQEQYDVITTFDVVHDAVDPRRLLRAIRQGLRP